MTSEELKKCRLAIGLTQKQLGEKMGYSQQAIARWENGYGDMSRHTDKIFRDFFKSDFDVEEIRMYEALFTYSEKQVLISIIDKRTDELVKNIDVANKNQTLNELSQLTNIRNKLL